MKKCLFIFDIDATIAHCGRRIAFAGEEPSRDDKAVYGAWVGRIQNAKSLMADKPVPGMLQIVKALADDLNNTVVYLTSREEKWREVTEAWLDKHRFPRWTNLYMRGNDDYRGTVDFKGTTIDELYSVSGCNECVLFDDDATGDLEAWAKGRGFSFLKARSGGQR